MRRLGLALLLAAVASAAARADDAETARRAVSYTLSVQREDGLFLYDFDFLSAAPSGEDNAVRQAGTLYALGEYLLHTGDERVAEALRRGLERMRTLSLPVGKSALQSALEPTGLYGIQSPRLASWLLRAGLLYRPEGEGRVVAQAGEGYEDAWAGTTALALIAEVEYRRATGDERFAGARAAWRQALLDLIVPGSGVRASPARTARSAYFDGETWLALAIYHEAFPGDAAASQALSELEDELMAWYGGEGRHRHFFHWGGMASAVRFRTTRDARFERFAADLAAWYLDDVPLDETASHTTCSAIEGTASVLATLAGRGATDPLVARLRERVTAELERNGGFQIRPGQDRMPLAKGGLLVAPVLAEHAGAILAGRYRAYTRIDLTQHCISGILKALRVGLGTGRLPRPDLPIGPVAAHPPGDSH
jgi:hypothetical protein